MGNLLVDSVMYSRVWIQVGRLVVDVIESR